MDFNQDQELHTTLKIFIDLFMLYFKDLTWIIVFYKEDIHNNEQVSQ